MLSALLFGNARHPPIRKRLPNWLEFDVIPVENRNLKLVR
jgi:hypothetical protein